MNWQNVKATPGQFIKLQVVITEISHKSGDYGPYALGKAQDGPGQIEDVFFTVKQGDQFPTQLAVGHRLNGAGKFDANKGKTKFFFDGYAQDQAPPPNSYPPIPPTGQPLIPLQQPTPSPGQQAATIAIDPTRISIERNSSWQTAAELLKNKTYPNIADLIGDLLKLAATGAKFMADGKDIPTMTPPARQPGEDGNPWD